MDSSGTLSYIGEQRPPGKSQFEDLWVLLMNLGMLTVLIGVIILVGWLSTVFYEADDRCRDHTHECRTYQDDGWYPEPNPPHSGFRDR